MELRADYHFTKKITSLFKQIHDENHANEFLTWAAERVMKGEKKELGEEK